MKTRGGLSGYPEFESIQFSVTFDGDWRILSADMREVAKVNKGVVVTSVSDFSTEYWYGDDHFDDAHYAYYDSYYKQYIGDSTLEPGGSSDEELVVDVTNVLSNGFSQIMNGGAQFEITAALGKNTYSGYVFISLDLADPLGTLELKLSLGKELKNQNFFLEYGCRDDIRLYAGILVCKESSRPSVTGLDLVENQYGTVSVAELAQVLHKVIRRLEYSGDSLYALDDDSGIDAFCQFLFNCFYVIQPDRFYIVCRVERRPQPGVVRHCDGSGCPSVERFAESQYLVFPCMERSELYGIFIGFCSAVAQEEGIFVIAACPSQL